MQRVVRFALIVNRRPARAARRDRLGHATADGRLLRRPELPLGGRARRELQAARRSAHASVRPRAGRLVADRADEAEGAARRRRSRVPALRPRRARPHGAPLQPPGHDHDLAARRSGRTAARRRTAPPTNMSTLTQFAQMLAGALQRPPRRLRLRVALDGLERAEPRAVPHAAVRRHRRSSARRPTRSSTWPPTRGSRPGNPLADVAVGETSNRGRNKPDRPAAARSRRRRSPACSPQANPKLPFAAWATHPYPTSSNLGPSARAAYPDVTMTRLDAVRRTSLEKWFHRRVPIWVTEYARADEAGVPARRVATRSRPPTRRSRSSMAAASPYVEMFVWFIIKDSHRQDLVQRPRREERRPRSRRTPRSRRPRRGSTARRRSIAAGQVADDPARHPVPHLRQLGRRAGSASPTASYDGKKQIAVGQPVGRIAADQTVSFVAQVQAGARARRTS